MTDDGVVLMTDDDESAVQCAERCAFSQTTGERFAETYDFQKINILRTKKKERFPIRVENVRFA